jgi:hypothetical protein
MPSSDPNAGRYDQRASVRLLTEVIQEIIGVEKLGYGTSTDGVRMIADLWTRYLGETITASDVCAMMVLLKVTRARVSPRNKDHWRDICGYSALAVEDLDRDD